MKPSLAFGRQRLHTNTDFFVLPLSAARLTPLALGWRKVNCHRPGLGSVPKSTLFPERGGVRSKSRQNLLGIVLGIVRGIVRGVVMGVVRGVVRGFVWGFGPGSARARAARVDGILEAARRRKERTYRELVPRSRAKLVSWQERLEDVGPPKLRLFSASSRQHAPVLRLLCCGRAEVDGLRSALEKAKKLNVQSRKGVYRSSREACGRFGRSEDEPGCNVSSQKYCAHLITRRCPG